MLEAQCWIVGRYRNSWLYLYPDGSYQPASQKAWQLTREAALRIAIADDGVVLPGEDTALCRLIQTGYQQGWDDRRLGNSCPYDMDTQTELYAAWEGGYLEADNECKKMLNDPD